MADPLSVPYNQKQRAQQRREWMNRLKSLSEAGDVAGYFAVNAEYLEWDNVISESRQALHKMSLAAATELAALRAERADDGEAVTKEWLRNVGFAIYDVGERGTEARQWVPDGSMLTIRKDETLVCEIEAGYLDVEYCKTRGDVRRLCAALGITLTQEERA